MFNILVKTKVLSRRLLKMCVQYSAKHTQKSGVTFTTKLQTLLFFGHYTTHWHLQRGRLGRKPNKQQISRVTVPGSGMDTPSPWRQGPDWEADNVAPMDTCMVLKEIERERESKRYLKRDCKRGTALIHDSV